MSRRRTLRPDEEALWNSVARSAKPLDGRPKPRPPAPPKPGIAPKPKEEPGAIPSFRVGEAAHPSRNTTAMPASPATRLAAEPVKMDTKAFGKLKRGKLSPEARLDLHGLTLDRAHPRLIQFILDAQARGLRLVLVITGKGRNDDPYDPAPSRRGILRRQVPLWLKQAPCGQAVLQIAQAHVRHGGDGAFYVYLRKAR